MKTSDILVGHVYQAVVDRKLEQVRVDRIRATYVLGGNGKPIKARFECWVYFSGGKVVELKAGQFRGEIIPRTEWNEMMSEIGEARDRDAREAKA